MDSMYAQAVSEGKDIGEAASEAIAYGVEKALMTASSRLLLMDLSKGRHRKSP